MIFYRKIFQCPLGVRTKHFAAHSTSSDNFFGAHSWRTQYFDAHPEFKIFFRCPLSTHQNIPLNLISKGDIKGIMHSPPLNLMSEGYIKGIIHSPQKIISLIKCTCNSFSVTTLRILVSYKAKTAKISNLWTFWPIIQLISHLFKI